MFGRGRGADHVFELMAGHGVDRALDPFVDKNLAHAHIAVDARADAGFLIVEQLVGQVGVGQELARHCDKITVATLEGRFTDFRLDAPHGNHRHLYAALEGGGPFQITAGLVYQWCLGKHHAAGDSRSGRYAHGIYPGGLCQARNGFGVFKIDAAGGVQLFGVQAQPHGKFMADLGPYGRDDLQQQPGAVFQRAAVFVFTLVVIARQEAGDDVAVGRVDLHTVETGAPGAIGGTGKPVNHLRDIGAVHHPDRRAFGAAFHGADKVGQLFRRQCGHHVALQHGRYRRHPQLPAFSHVAHCSLARVLQLHGDFGAVLMHAFGQATEPGDKVIAGNADLEWLGGAGRERHRAHAHDQQPGTATGAGFVIGLDALATLAIGLGEIGAHRRHDDAVAQFHRTDATRCQQLRVFCHCYFSPSGCWKGLRLPAGSRS